MGKLQYCGLLTVYYLIDEDQVKSGIPCKIDDVGTQRWM